MEQWGGLKNLVGKNWPSSKLSLPILLAFGLGLQNCLLDKGPAKSEFNNPDGLKINEILAQSDTEDDWLELYAAGKSDVNLEQYTLADGKSGRIPAELPDIVLSSGDFIRILAVDTPYTGAEYYVPFKLGKKDELKLFYQGDLADEVKWDENVWVNGNSLGRSPDGSDNFVSMLPSPESKNNIPLESD